MTARQKIVAKHGLLWLAYFLYSWLAYASLVSESCSETVTDPYEAQFFCALISVSLAVGATYFTIYGLLERYLLAGQRRAFYFACLAV